MGNCPYEITACMFVCRRGEPITDNCIKQLFSKAKEKISFSLSPHKLRHNFATNYCIDMSSCKIAFRRFYFGQSPLSFSSTGWKAALFSPLRVPYITKSASSRIPILVGTPLGARLAKSPFGAFTSVNRRFLFHPQDGKRLSSRPFGFLI